MQIEEDSSLKAGACLGSCISILGSINYFFLT